MPVLLWVSIAVILVAVFFTATGRGGELAYEHADHAPLNLGSVSGADVAMLRPPTALWGYNMQVTDTALDTIAQALRDRDVTIAHLQQQLADLSYHVHGTTPAPPVRQDFPTRIDEGQLGFQPRPFPGRHEAQPLTPPEAWLAPAEAPAAEALPDPLVWEAPDPEPEQHQPGPSPEDQAPPPSPHDQLLPTSQEEPSPAAQDQPGPSPEDQAPLDPADQAGPRDVGSGPAPALAPDPAAASASGPGAVPDAPAVAPGGSDVPAGPDAATTQESGPSAAADQPAPDGGDDAVEQR